MRIAALGCLSLMAPRLPAAPWDLSESSGATNSCSQLYGGMSPSLAAFEQSRRARIEAQLGGIWESVSSRTRNAMENLRRRQRAGEFYTQHDAAQAWRDFTDVLSENPDFNSIEILSKKDKSVVFYGSKDGVIRFLSVTPDEPPKIFFGVRDTRLSVESDWREGNRELTEWKADPPAQN